MIPIDMNEAKRAFIENKIDIWAMSFLEGVEKEEHITEKQYDKIVEIAKKMLPFKLLITTDLNGNGCKTDIYFNQKYYPDEY
jgi:hypothetical protein